MNYNKIKKIFIRNEVYENEFRCPIIPDDIQKLVNNGYIIYVQSSKTRCFNNDAFLKAGAVIVDTNWELFNDALIIGIKELENIEKLNSHLHVYFSHSYKKQFGADKILSLFKNSNSLLFDLEYFVDMNKKRIIAFGFYAGLIGAGLGILQYLNKINKKSNIKNLNYWKSSKSLLHDIKKFDNYSNLNVCIIGPNGRCGIGAKYLLEQLNIKYCGLGSCDPKNNLESYDIVINCINLTKPVGIWYDANTKFTKHTVITDVSCDYTNKLNPIKLYMNRTTWKEPIYSYNKFVDIIAIDNLPSLLPYESSIEFSSILVKLILQLESDTNGFWKTNLNHYFSKIKNV